MLKEVPQKGWYILKDENSDSHINSKVYLDGKLLGGLQKVSVELDAEKQLPVLKLEVIPIEGMIVDLVFGAPKFRPVCPQPEITVFRSVQTPEEILKALKVREPKEYMEPVSEIEVL